MRFGIKDIFLATAGVGVVAAFWRINAGLGAQGLVPGTSLYAQYFRDVQNIVDAGDPLNFVTVAAQQRSIYFQQMVGDAAAVPAVLPDQVIPNSATQRLITAITASGQHVMLGIPSLHVLMLYRVDGEAVKLVAVRNFGPDLFVTGMNTSPDPRQLMQQVLARAKNKQDEERIRAAFGLDEDSQPADAAPAAPEGLAAAVETRQLDHDVRPGETGERPADHHRDVLVQEDADAERLAGGRVLPADPDLESELGATEHPRGQRHEEQRDQREPAHVGDEAAQQARDVRHEEDVPVVDGFEHVGHAADRERPGAAHAR